MPDNRILAHDEPLHLKHRIGVWCVGKIRWFWRMTMRWTGVDVFIGMPVRYAAPPVFDFDDEEPPHA
jgi:hypothetical protein